MSRTNDRRFLFEKGRVKTQLVDALKRAAAFSGVELEAYVAMDNHFHIVCKVVRGTDELPEGELLRRIAALKGERAAEDLASHWKELRDIGMDSAVVDAQDRLRARMNDVSEFIKTFKELFNVWYKRERGYSGSIWDGMVKHATDYAWSWIATSDGTFAGPVPEERLMRRVAQIGAGKIFGSLAFVTATAFALGDRFRSRSVAAREVGELGYATHGWRLAKAAERAA